MLFLRSCSPSSSLQQLGVLAGPAEVLERPRWSVGEQQADHVALVALLELPTYVPTNKTTQQTPPTMRSFFLGLFLALLSFVSALSAAGSKLLVVVDDEADKGKYSTFWSDLQCKSFAALRQYH
jgi:hypothetical protein